MSISSSGQGGPDKEVSLVVSTFSGLDAATRLELPTELSNLNGISFKAKAVGGPISLDVEVRDDADVVLHTQTIAVGTEWASHTLPFAAVNMRQIKYTVNLDDQQLDGSGEFNAAAVVR